MFLTGILSKNFVLTSWILKFQTLKVERKACYTMVIVNIELMLYSDFHLPLVGRGQQTLNSTLANGRTVDESRYHNFGLDSEIQSVYTLKYL